MNGRVMQKGERAGKRACLTLAIQGKDAHLANCAGRMDTAVQPRRTRGDEVRRRPAWRPISVNNSKEERRGV